MGKALDGVRISTSRMCSRVRPARSCWPGCADVIKIERAGAGDITREQLRDIPDVDSLYFTMLNHNSGRSRLTPRTRTAKRYSKAHQALRRAVENFAPGALDLWASPGSASSSSIRR